jgi:hypothetical protein
MENTGLIPDHVPETWPAAAVTATCTCAVPVPHVHAERKGAARTLCTTCGRPIRIGFRW